MGVQGLWVGFSGYGWGSQGMGGVLLKGWGSKDWEFRDWWNWGIREGLGGGNLIGNGCEVQSVLEIQ